MNKYAFGSLVGVGIVGAAFISGFFIGKRSQRDRELQKTIEALYEREKINEKISKFDDVDLCVALGGLPDDCVRFLRRLDKTTSSQ